jgi:hypothetical protein
MSILDQILGTLVLLGAGSGLYWNESIVDPHNLHGS